MKKKSKAPKKRAKKTAKRRPVRKKALKKKVAARKKKVTAKKKAVRKAVTVKPRKTAPAVTKPAAKPSPKPAVSPVVEAAKELPVGKVIHYYTHLEVAVVELDRGSLQAGDTIHVKGHTTDFRQVVQSMEIEHVKMQRADPGQDFGLKVTQHVRENDVVYKVIG